MRDVPLQVRALILTVATGGLGLLLWSMLSLELGWLPLICVAVSAGADFLRVDLKTYNNQHKASVTLDIIAIFFMLRLFGLPWAMLTLLTTTLIFGITKRIPAYKLAYNVGTLALSTGAASVVLQAPWLPSPVAITAGAILYFVINTGLISAVLSLVNRRPLVIIWQENWRWMAAQHIAIGIAGYVLGGVVGQMGWGALLVALPLPMLHYTYSLYAKTTQKHTEELQHLSDDLIKTLAAVVDARDAYTFGHSTHVARYSKALAEQMGYTHDEAERLHRSALLHDIGKVGIPESILFKPGRLTPEEYELMKRHTTIGYEIIKNIPSLQDAADVALLHHERWNGAGYPLGLAGEQVDLDSRIVGVADTLDTILSDRPYRRGCSLEEALAEIRRCTGTQFDPSVVAALEHLVKERGSTFFVNSAHNVPGAGAKILQWSPNDLADQVAAGNA